MKNNMKKHTNLPLNAISFLQQLANGNPKLVTDASSYIYSLRDKFEKNKITEIQYQNAINKYIDNYPKN
jgi:hypothetical protein